MNNWDDIQAIYAKLQLARNYLQVIASAGDTPSADDTKLVVREIDEAMSWVLDLYQPQIIGD